jgi:HAE1 family hydrophobic/amphiphilic exporter-1
MLLGTVLGVFMIPGLYYIVARFSDGRRLIRDEHKKPLSEVVEGAQNPRDPDSQDSKVA